MKFSIKSLLYLALVFILFNSCEENSQSLNIDRSCIVTHIEDGNAIYDFEYENGIIKKVTFEQGINFTEFTVEINNNEINLYYNQTRDVGKPIRVKYYFKDGQLYKDDYFTYNEQLKDILAYRTVYTLRNGHVVYSEEYEISGFSNDENDFEIIHSETKEYLFHNGKLTTINDVNTDFSLKFDYTPNQDYYSIDFLYNYSWMPKKFQVFYPWQASRVIRAENDVMRGMYSVKMEGLSPFMDKMDYDSGSKIAELNYICD